MNREIRVFMVAAEGVPFAKTGGLADVVGALPYALAEHGCSVRCFLPRYRQVDLEKFGLSTLLPRRTVSFAGAEVAYRVLAAPAERGVEWLFLDAPGFYDRDALYGTYGEDYPDSCERFAFFCQQALATVRELDWRPDVVHCHDWQSGLIPAYLKLKTRTGIVDTFDTFFSEIRSLFTIHNIGYQGMFSADKLWITGFSPEHFTYEKLEYWGSINFLKAGIVFADRISTVSKRYSEEIQTEAFGRGMDGVLRARAADLTGILNGIDVETWNPATDPHIAANYTAEDLRGKRECRRALSKEVGLNPRVRVPLIGVISRLEEEKGFDLLSSAIPRIMAMGAQMVVLGTGSPEYHTILSRMARRYSGQFAAVLAFDPVLAHRVEAGADMFLMPSKYEPCGLTQMYSMRYGTVPIVHATGGLADTVTNYDGRTKRGNGFSFSRYSVDALLTAVRRAMKFFNDRERWESIMRAGMRQDFSWSAAADQYRMLYDELLNRADHTNS